jgi:hypothetical protein
LRDNLVALEGENGNGIASGKKPPVWEHTRAETVDPYFKSTKLAFEGHNDTG